MSLTGKTNEQKIWNYLTGKGLSPAGAAGVMGNLYAESGLRASNLENRAEKELGMTDASYTAAVDNDEYLNFVNDGAGYGLAQWTFHSRKAGLLASCKAAGTSVGDLEAQLDFLYYELSNAFDGLLSALREATSVKAASDAFLIQFERPADAGDAIKTKRAGYGQKYFDKFAGTADSATEAGRYTAKRLIEIAAAEIGYHEKASNSDLDDPTANSGGNNWTKYARDLAAAGYYNSYNKNGFAWCAMFVNWCFYRLADCDAEKAQEIECQTGPYGAGCIFARQYYQQQGRLFTTPQPGDQVFFQHNGEITHTGIVETVNGDTITTIEGNSADQVARRSYSLSNSYVKDFGRPKYDSDTTESSPGATPTVEPPIVEVEPPAATVAKTVDELAREVLTGLWGVGAERKTRLTEAGYDYAAVQARVNELCGATQAREWQIGDVVNFTGTIHYVSSNAQRGVTCRGGKATITSVHKKGIHPYHLIRVPNSGATVYGWVDKEYLKELTT